MDSSKKKSSGTEKSIDKMEDNKKIDKDDEENSASVAKVATLASNIQKFSTKTKYSQAEREAILAKIGLYLIGNKEKDKKPFNIPFLNKTS